MVTKLFRRRKLCDCRREILLLMEHCFSFECFPLATIVFFLFEVDFHWENSEDSFSKG